MSAAVKLSDLPPRVRRKLTGTKRSKEVARAIRAEEERQRRDAFLAVIARAKLPHPTPEHHFHPERMWRFDYAWPEHRIALEVEGGVWTQGRHTRGSGFVKDMEKYNAAAVLGWRVLRVTPEKLTTRGTEEMLRRVLK